MPTISTHQLTAKTLITRTLTQWSTYTDQPSSWLMDAQSQPTLVTGLNELNTLHLWLIKNVKGNSDRTDLVSLIERLQNMLRSWKEGYESRNVTAFDARVFQPALRIVLKTALGFVSSLEESDDQLTDTQVSTNTKTLLSGPHQQVRRRAAQLDMDTYNWTAYRSQLPVANARNSANRVNLRMNIIPVLKGIVTAQRLVDVGLVSRQLGDYALLDQQMILAVRTDWWLSELDKDQRDDYLDKVLGQLRTKFSQEFVRMSAKSVTDKDCGYTMFWLAPSSLYTTLSKDIKTQVLDWSFA